MTTIRKEWPRVHQYTKHGNTYYSVNMRRKHYHGPKTKNFTNREQAKDFAAQIALKAAQTGLSSLAVLGVDPRLKAWQEQFAIYGKTLEEGIAAGVAVFEKERQVKESPHMAGLVTAWMDDKTKNTLKPLRADSKATLRGMADIFKAEFGTIRIKEVTKASIEDWLTKKDCSQRYKWNLRNYLGNFFNYCIAKGHLEKNPAKGISVQVIKDPPKYFRVEQCEALMKTVSKSEHRDLIPYFSLCLFAGIRPKEVQRMTWANIKGTQIDLPASITKTKRGRLFVMSNNLRAWLDTAKNQKVLVDTYTLNHRISKIAKEAGVEWIADGLRHTFATYHYAKHDSMDQLYKIMGNSKQVIESCYKGHEPKLEADKFWAISPA